MPVSKYSAGFEEKRFNRTVAKCLAFSVKKGRNGSKFHWIFLCDCGIWHVSDIRSATRGMVQSCGCLGREKLGLRTKHGHCGKGWESPEMRSWKKMKARCYNPKNEWFHRYGGRGIKVCEGLRNSLSHFLSVLGPRPSKRTVDRVNNDGHYSCGLCAECQSETWPMNLRWATVDEQNANKATTRLVAFNGKTQALFLWARELGITSGALAKRIRNWPLERALSQRSTKT